MVSWRIPFSGGSQNRASRAFNPNHSQEGNTMKTPTSWSRRDFLRAGPGSAALLLGTSLPLPADSATAKLPQRMLGKTGVKVPILGMGTVAVGNMPNEKETLRLLNKAIDLGVTYIDTAPPRTRIALLTGYAKAQQYLKI